MIGKRIAPVACQPFAMVIESIDCLVGWLVCLLVYLLMGRSVEILFLCPVGNGSMISRKYVEYFLVGYSISIILVLLVIVCPWSVFFASTF